MFFYWRNRYYFWYTYHSVSVDWKDIRCKHPTFRYYCMSPPCFPSQMDTPMFFFSGSR